MTRLADLQAQFQAHVVTGDAAAIESFVGTAFASAEERLGVYYQAYRLRLTEILRDDFPGLCALLSAEEFDALAQRYLAAHPSQHPSVRNFGRHLAEFLVTDVHAAGRPYLAEMAAFEWVRGLAFDAAAVDALTLVELGALPAEDWPALTLRFHPSLHRVVVTWNVAPIWRAVNAEEPVPEPAALDGAQTLAVWRRGLTLYWRSFDAFEVRALQSFADGNDFAEVCALLSEFMAAETVPAKMAGWLNQWVTEGLIANPAASLHQEQEVDIDATE